MFEDTDILATLWLYTSPRTSKHLEVIFDIPSNRSSISLATNSLPKFRIEYDYISRMRLDLDA